MPSKRKSKSSSDKERIKAVVEEVSSAPAPEDSSKASASETKAEKEEKTEKKEEESETTEETERVDPSLETEPEVSAPEGESFSQPQEKKGNFKVIFFTALITAVIVAALAGGVYVYLAGINKLPQMSGEGIIATPTSIATPTPTPTPEAEVVDLTEYEVQVLNGVGTAGVASTVKTLLEEAGFEDVVTSNATTFDFEETVIQAKETVPEGVIDAIETALETDYLIEIGDDLDEDSDYDVIVTVGSSAPETTTAD